ncbi:hypothetical protein Pint_01281 [Pistacia integerrima]|uniref:Uncharacterized protein n=1 Tax=Pistacia integerrima TaxID=434235 RepID=A0ACC0ZPL4_9ROSI|nr:hypothetical protein Pint_01281 [Pistacia integerrima]
MAEGSNDMHKNTSSLPNGTDGKVKTVKHPRWTRQESLVLIQGKKRTTQCQKRWSNILVDFKKIKTWESQMKGEVKSFWMMRNDLRKEMKLPGFFDIEVYDVLDVGVLAMPAVPLALLTTIIDAEDGKHYKIMTVAEKEDEDYKAETVFDSSQQAPAQDDTRKEKCPESSKCTGSTSQERWKRRRLSLCVSEDKNMGDRLVTTVNKLTDALLRIANKF